MFLLISALPFYIAVFIYFMVSDIMKSQQQYPNPMGFIYYSIIFLSSYFISNRILFVIKNENWRYLIFISISAFLFCTVINIFGKPLLFSVAGPLYFISSLISIRKTGQKISIISIVLFLPFFIILIFLPSFYKDALPEMFYPVAIFIVISIFAAKLFFRFILNKNVLGKTIIVAVLSITSITGYAGMMNYLEFLFSRNDRLPADNYELSFQTMNDSIIYNVNWKGKIVVLDFWTTTCSVCFKKFPEFEEFYQKHRDREDIMIYAVNIPARISDSLPEVKRIVDKLNFSFPILYALQDYDYYEKVMKINGVPHLAIFDKNGKLAYSGNFNNNPLILVNNLERMIDTIQ
ncbi:MAG TPA: TlpA disulfide reductase family protein [Bacteroidales bacterium]